MKPMRVVVSAVFVAALGAASGLGGVAVAQVPGQPVVSHASYTVEPFAPPGAPITIQGTGVRLRAEPFSTPQTQVLSSGSTGHVLNVVGIARLSDWNWYQVVLKNGQKAFIRSDLTSSPSRGNGQVVAAAPVAPVAPAAPVAAAPMPATPVVTAPSTYTPTPPPTPQPYVPPPQYSQPVPIAPQPVPLAPAATPTPPVTNSVPSLDLPKPSDPAGLRSN